MSSCTSYMSSSTEYLGLDSCGKYYYVCRHQCVHRDQPLHRQNNKFDGTIVMQRTPKRLFRVEVFEQIRRLINSYGKYKNLSKKRVKESNNIVGNATLEDENSFQKIDNFEQIASTFIQNSVEEVLFYLPYWKYNSFQPCLDVMHI